jgi:hypothetical protein
LRLNALPPSESEQLASQRCCTLGSPFNGLQGFKCFFARDVLTDGMNASGNDHQEIVEVVSHAAGQLAKRVELLGLRELPLNLEKFLLRRFFPLGNVTGDFGKTDKLAGLIANGIDDDARPEKRAVLPDAPSIFYVVSGLDRNLECPGGLPSCLIGWCVKAREMLPDDLARGISLDALAADISVRHMPLRIEHKSA